MRWGGGKWGECGGGEWGGGESGEVVRGREWGE